MDEADQLLLQGDYPNAIDLYDQVIHLNPNYARPHYKKGIALGRLQKLTEANDSFDSAIQVDPTHYDAWYEKGNILVELGKENEAVDSYNKVMQINPRHTKSLNRKRVVVDRLEEEGTDIDHYATTGEPRIAIEDIDCSDEKEGTVRVKFTISGIRHGSKKVSMRILVISSSGNLVYSGDIPVPGDAPDPASSTTSLALNVKRDTFTLKANVNSKIISKAFETPSCV
jgi:tetratricopeptide (TPR) repeat protein